MHFIGYIVLHAPLPSKYILRLFQYQVISSKAEHFSLRSTTVLHI